MVSERIKAYLAIVVSVFVWSTTSISTKILLRDLSPLQILIIRFALGSVVLWIVYPKPLKEFGGRREVYYMLAGLTGVCMFFWMDHIALSYTTVTNVGVLSSITPILTAVCAYFFLKERQLKGMFWLGAVISLTGVVVYYMAGATLRVHVIGDSIALMSSIVWATYSIFLTKISHFGLPLIQTTRRINLYGLCFISIIFFLTGEQCKLSALVKPEYILHFLYLAVGASSLCFVAWSYALKVVGAGKANICSYFGIIITILSSAIALGERLSQIGIIAAALIMTGVIIAEQGDSIVRLLYKKKERN